MSASNEADRPGIIALAAEMSEHGAERDAPIREIFALLGDRWTTLILLVLATGDWRHAELRRTLAHLSSEQAISQRILTLKLRKLERSGIVLRAVSEDVPPKVSYSLSAMGGELALEARRLINWVIGKADAVLAARAAYDAADP